MSKYYLGKSREEIASVFNTGNVYEGEAYKKASLQLWGNDFLEKYAAVSNWEQAYKKAIEFFVVDSNQSVTRHLPLGISSEFKKIKTVEQVRKFTAKYGPLGVGRLKDYEIMQITQLPSSVDVGISIIEPIEFWYDCAKKVRCIISLYDALQISFKEHTELELNCEEVLGSNGVPVAYRYSWIYIDGKEECSLSTLCEIEEIGTDIDLNKIIEQNLKIGRNILIQAIKPLINGHLFIDEQIVPNEHSSLGIEIIEHKYTDILITAIFYDLWLLLVANVPAGRCKKCNKPFLQAERGRKREFCSESCRVIWNRKHPKKEANE